jgi:hypothetical protein
MKKLILATLISIAVTPLVSFAANNQQVADQPSDKAVAAAIQGYNKAVRDGAVKDDRYLTIVDFTKPSYENRFYIYDIKQHRAVYSTLVAQGKGSGQGAYATKFSNDFGTHASSLGTFITTGTGYGDHGKDIHMEGLDRGINDNAAARAVEIHSAWYVSPEFATKYHRVGNSFGCFALSQDALNVAAGTISNGTVLYAYA